MTEQELIDGIIAGDKLAVESLVNRYHQRVIKTAYHFLKDMDDAEDLAQDVCLQLLESIPRFRKDASLSTWIYRITVNKSLNHLRKNKKNQWIERIEMLFQSNPENSRSKSWEPSSEPTVLDDKERKRILEKAINGLPENQRTAFILSKYEELSYKQIAEIMEVSLASVESYLQRAKQNLQKELIGYFQEYSSKKTVK